MEASNSNAENPCRKREEQRLADEYVNARPINDEGYVKDNTDQRVRFESTDIFPFSAIGIFFVVFDMILYFGTGIMIGPNIVLTAGHNLYDSKTKKFAERKKMQFMPGMNGKKLPFGVVEVAKYYVSPNYVKEGKEDYGILILEEPIGEETGFFSLSNLDTQALVGKEVYVLGYPVDKVQSKVKEYELWGCSEVVSSIRKGLITYFINTAPGQSGSGVYYEEKEKYWICGVHVKGNRAAGQGTLLTEEIRAQIYKWQREFNNYKEESNKSKKQEGDFWNIRIDEVNNNLNEFEEENDKRG